MPRNENIHFFLSSQLSAVPITPYTVQLYIVQNQNLNSTFTVWYFIKIRLKVPKLQIYFHCCRTLWDTKKVIFQEESNHITRLHITFHIFSIQNDIRNNVPNSIYMHLLVDAKSSLIGFFDIELLHNMKNIWATFVLINDALNISNFQQIYRRTDKYLDWLILQFGFLLLYLSEAF